MNSDRKGTIAAALERRNAGKRLTTAQGKNLADEYERLIAQVFALQQSRADVYVDLEVEKEFHQTLIMQWNVLVHMLDRVLSIHVYGNAHDEWIAEDVATGSELARATSIVETFEAVLKMRLAGED